MRNNLKIEVTEFEQKIAELERQCDALVEKYRKITQCSNKLLQEYGSQISRHIDAEVEARINDIEYRILKKLVDGDVFELKVKKPNKSRQKRAL